MPQATVISSDAEAIAAARRYAAEIASGAAERDRTGAHPYRELERLGATGLLGIAVPRAHGGADVTQETLAEMFRIIAAADGSLAQIPQNHFVFLDVIRHVGSPSQQAFFFDEALRGARLGNAQTERGTAHAKALNTRLEPDGAGSFLLNGRKFYCTGAISAQWIPVLAKDTEDRTVVAMVPRNAEGVELIDDWSAMGQRTTGSGTTILTNVRVPRDHVVPHWRLFERPRIWAAAANLSHVAIDLGIAENARADTIAFIRDKARPWYEAGVDSAAEDPLLLHRLGQLSARFHAAEALVQDAARLLDRVKDRVDASSAAAATLAVSEAKAFVGDVSTLLGSELFALGGASTADERHGFDRHWRNARTHTLHDPNRWRYHRLGDYFLNGRLPSNNRAN
jgi:SfnB family sulfur acquisition oxidoreductase